MGMKEKRMRSNYPGVYFRDHESRKHGRKLDQYFSIRYRLKGKLKEEGLGYASEGWDAQKANERLSELKANHRTGEGPKTLAEKRELARAKELERERKARQEARRRITFRAYFEKIYYPYSKTSKKQASSLVEQQHFKHWIGPVLGDAPFQKIVPLHLEKVKKNMMDAGRAPRTVQYCFATFNQVWGMARRDGLVSGDSPAKSVRLPKINNARIRFLSHDEADSLLIELKSRSQQLHDMALLSLHTGMRAGEILDLRGSDVDLPNQVITIKNAKGNKDRTVCLTEETAHMLERKTLNNGLVFKSLTGGRMIHVSESFNRAVDALGLNKGVKDRKERLVFHTLRHTFASWHAMNGTDLYTLQKLMGHSSLAMTERYAHLSNGTLKDATRNFDKALKNRSKQAKVIPFPS